MLQQTGPFAHFNLPYRSSGLTPSLASLSTRIGNSGYCPRLLLDDFPYDDSLALLFVAVIFLFFLAPQTETVCMSEVLVIEQESSGDGDGTENGCEHDGDGRCVA